MTTPRVYIYVCVCVCVCVCVLPVFDNGLLKSIAAAYRKLWTIKRTLI